MTNSSNFTSPLATQEQSYGEKKVLDIIASPKVQSARKKARALMTTHVISEGTDAKNRIDYALDHWMAQLATQDVGSDLHQPRILWNANITRYSWFGHIFPGSAAGIDCPDNVYRTLALNGSSQYEIVGRVHSKRPAQFSFHLTPHPGADGFWTTEDMQDIGGFDMLTDENLEIAEDGTFRIILGPEPANGRANYLQMPPGKKIVLIRDTLSDWTQIPNTLTVRYMGGETLPDQPLTEPMLVNQTARGLEQNIAFWLRFIGNFHPQSKPNKLIPPYGRTGALGYASAAKFDLQNDQAIVITVTHGNASYTGMQIADRWGIAPSPIETISSYNKAQAITNPDGTQTFIIARQDPGYANWVDTLGWQQGWIFFRWQGVPNDLEPSSLIVKQQVVHIADLPSVLPDSLPGLSKNQRAKELIKRVAQWQLRIANSE